MYVVNGNYYTFLFTIFNFAFYHLSFFILIYIFLVHDAGQKKVKKLIINLLLQNCYYYIIYLSFLFSPQILLSWAGL